jgi:accessory gene regulator protein AgrB
MNWSERLSIHLARKIIPEGQNFTIGQVSHGIEIFMLLVAYLILTLAVAAVLGIFSQALALMVALTSVRSFTGGAHFKNLGACFVSSTWIILMGAYVIQWLPMGSRALSLALTGGMVLTSLWVNLRYGPAEHSYVQIADERKRRNKKMTLFLLIAGALLSVLTVQRGYAQLAYVFGVAVLLQAVLLHPICHKIMGRIDAVLLRKEVPCSGN